MCLGGDSPAPPKVKPLPPPPKATDPEIELQVRQQRELAAQRAGRAKTIATSATGLGAYNGTQKTLLGS